MPSDYSDGSQGSMSRYGYGSPVFCVFCSGGSDRPVALNVRGPPSNHKEHMLQIALCWHGVAFEDYKYP